MDSLAFASLMISSVQPQCAFVTFEEDEGRERAIRAYPNAICYRWCMSEEKKIDGFAVAHAGKFFLHVHRLVVPSGGVEQFPDIAFVTRQHCLEFRLGWWLFPNRN